MNWARDFLQANPGKTVLARHSHGITFARPDGLKETHCTGLPVHYEETPGNWQPIDTALVDYGTHIGGRGTKTRLRSDGTASIEGGTFNQRTTRVGLFRPSTQNVVGAVNVPVGRTIQDDSLVTSGVIGGAAWEHRMRVTEVGMRETLTLASKPTISGVQANDWLILETRIEGKTWPNGWVDAEWEQDGHRFTLPRAWDATPKPVRNLIPCRRYARTVAGVQYVYTGIAVTDLATATYPITIDPDYAGDSADFYVIGTDLVYATARSTASLWGSGTANAPTVGQNFDGSNNYLVYRGGLKFLTSGIPDTDTITQVNMKLTLFANNSTTDFDYQIVKYDWSANDPISAGNYETLYDGILAASLDDNIWQNSSVASSVGTQYTSGNLSTAWINKSGATYYAMRSSRDSSSTAPTGLEEGEICSQDHATAGYRPVLTVLHAETNITGVTATATAAGIAGTVAAVRIVNITGVTASATAAGNAGVVNTVRFAAISGIAAAATAAGNAGVVAAVRILSVVGATASAIASGIAGIISAVMSTGGSAGPSVAGTLDTGGSAGPSIAASDTGGSAGPTVAATLDTGGDAGPTVPNTGPWG